jgi:hypothetical protein
MVSAKRLERSSGALDDGEPTGHYAAFRPADCDIFPATGVLSATLTPWP